MDGGPQVIRSALVAAALASALVGATLAASPASGAENRDAKAEVDNVAVLGQTMGTIAQDSDRGAVVMSVHGVRRIPDGTVLYWSIGNPTSLPADRGDGGSGLWPNWFAYDRYGAKGEPKGVSVIDPVGRKVYEPLIPGEGEACLCSPGRVSGQRGEVTVLYAVVPPLPADVTTVDVRLGFGSVVQDVPVEDGLLEPAAPASDRLVLLGQIWPAVDQAAVSAAHQPEKAIYPLTTKEATKDDSLTTEENTEEVVLSLASDVLFARDEATLSGRAGGVIAAAAEQVNASAGGGTLAVVGHTDSDAGTSYNQKLSERRAQAVADALEKQLTVDVRVVVSGEGESEPVASNKTDKGKALNRRVSLTFTPKAA